MLSAAVCAGKVKCEIKIASCSRKHSSFLVVDHCQQRRTTSTHLRTSLGFTFHGASQNTIGDDGNYSAEPEQESSKQFV